MTDKVFGYDDALPYSLALSVGPAAFLGFIVAFLGLKAYAELQFSLSQRISSKQRCPKIRREASIVRPEPGDLAVLTG